MPVSPQIVWICQWYPHEGDPYAGDFIQRHAQAAALFVPVTSFACFAHTTDKVETNTTGNLTEHVIYFKPVKTGIPILDKVLRLRKWYRLLKQHLQNHISKNGKPDLLHCHIILNTGWLGLWAKRKYKIPYVVSEHWSGYMPGAVKGFDAYNPWSKKMCAKILKESAAATGVSNALIEVLQHIQPQAAYIRIPNVVNEQIFQPSLVEKPAGFFRLLHISTFAPQKNMDAMFATFDALATENENLQFDIVGPREKMAEKWKARKFSPHYVFHGEMPQENLAALMHSCDVCVLYSHYETFGCVIIEANAAGLPVVVSDIPVLQEIVEPGINGVLAGLSTSRHLQETLLAIINGNQQFDTHKIATDTLEKYAYEKVGRQFYELYKQVIKVEREGNG